MTFHPAARFTQTSVIKNTPLQFLSPMLATWLDFRCATATVSAIFLTVMESQVNSGNGVRVPYDRAFPDEPGQRSHGLRARRQGPLSHRAGRGLRLIPVHREGTLTVFPAVWKIFTASARESTAGRRYWLAGQARTATLFRKRLQVVRSWRSVLVLCVCDVARAP